MNAIAASLREWTDGTHDDAADLIEAADRLADAVATLDSKTVVLDEYRSWLPEVKTLLDALAAYRSTQK